MVKRPPIHVPAILDINLENKNSQSSYFYEKEFDHLVFISIVQCTMNLILKYVDQCLKRDFNVNQNEGKLNTFY